MKKRRLCVLWLSSATAVGAILLLLSWQSVALQPGGTLDAAAAGTTDTASAEEEFTWQGTRAMNLSRSESNSIDKGTQFPRIALDQNGRAHVLWTGIYGAVQSEVFMCSRPSVYSSWATPEVISPSSKTRSEHAESSTDEDDNLHAVWAEQLSYDEYRVFYQKRSTGGTLAVHKQLASLTDPPAPTIATNEQRVHAAWLSLAEERFDFDISHRYSLDGGKNWSSSATAVALTSSSMNVAMTVDGEGRVHLVWAESVKEGAKRIGKIMYRAGVPTQSGIDWGPITTVSPRGDNCVHPSIATIGTDILIAWGKIIEPQKFELHFASCAGEPVVCNAQEIGIPVVVNTSDPAQAAPVLAVDAEKEVVAVWHGDQESTTPGPGTFEEVLFSRSTDGGQTWSLVTNVSQTPNERSIDPDVRVSDGIVHVVWRERYEEQDGQKYDTWYVNSLRFINLPLIMRN